MEAPLQVIRGCLSLGEIPGEGLNFELRHDAAANDLLKSRIWPESLCDELIVSG
jgi:hypothetical protein